MLQDTHRIYIIEMARQGYAREYPVRSLGGPTIDDRVRDLERFLAEAESAFDAGEISVGRYQRIQTALNHAYGVGWSSHAGHLVPPVEAVPDAYCKYRVRRRLYTVPSLFKAFDDPRSERVRPIFESYLKALEPYLQLANMMRVLYHTQVRKESIAGRLSLSPNAVPLHKIDRLDIAVRSHADGQAYALAISDIQVPDPFHPSRIFFSGRIELGRPDASVLLRVTSERQMAETRRGTRSSLPDRAGL